MTDKHTDAASAVTRVEIAIVGMAGCYAGARDMPQFWQNILNKVDAVRDADAEWVGPYFDPNPTSNDRTYTIKGGFLGELAEVDPREFGVLPTAAEGGEPDHMLALKHARDALADAGYLTRPFDRERAGIVLGRGTYANRGNFNLLSHGLVIDQTMSLMRHLRPDLTEADWASLRAELKSQLPPYNADLVAPLTPNVITGLIANRLNLMGPNFIVDAACASSLIALDVAVRELQTGRSDLMLSGGVHAQVPPQLYIQFCLLNALSRDKIRPFSKSAGGTLLGEGCGVLVLKRLADAERDGDRIYAVIKGIGTSSDGKAKGLLAPRLEGEILALKRAYQGSGIDPNSVGLIEAHGTGTAVGDRTEIEALASLFGNTDTGPRIAMGAVKSMIGHCLPASGSASLIKTALALHHKVLPPTLCDEPDPSFDWSRTPLYVNTETRPWIHGKAHPRRAGVSAFGFGGINAHVILEEYRPAQDVQMQALHAPSPTELITLAAASSGELAQLADTAVAHLRGPAPLSLAELAKASAAQSEGSHRLGIVAESRDDAIKKLEQAAEKLRRPDPKAFKTRSGSYYGAGSPAGKACFLYPGEGSQYPNMLADVSLNFPQCRDWFDFLEETGEKRGAAARSAVLFPPPSMLSEAQRKELEDRLFDMDIAAESVFAASMGLHALLDQLQLKPDAILGHSTGENTALTVGGVRRYERREELSETVRDLQTLYRDLDQAGRIAKGTLLTIGALRPEVRKELLDNPGHMQLAMDNCPNQVVMFGPAQEAQALQEKLSAEGAVCAVLPFGRAYHTPLFKPMADAYRDYFRRLDFGAGSVPLYSARSAGPFPAEPDAIRELAAQQWENPVRFTETVETLYADGFRVFVEVGPSSNLTSFVGDILRDKADVVAVACNSRRRSGVQQLHQMLAQLFAAGIAFRPAALYEHRALASVDLLAAPRPQRKPVPKLKLQMSVLQFPKNWKPAAKPFESTGPMNGPAVVNNPKVVPLRARDGMPASARPGASEPAADPRAAAVQAHFALMQEFIASQSRVLATMGLPMAPATMPTLPAITAPKPAGAAAAVEYPMLGTIVERSENRLVAERRFVSDRDHIFHDHAIGAAPSTRDPLLRALEVIPFTFSMEIIAEAAMALAGAGMKVTGMRDMRGHRWLSLDDGSINLRIVAERAAAAGPEVRAVSVRVFLPANGAPPGGLLVFEGTVELSAQRQPAPAPIPWGDAESRPPVVNLDDRLYSLGMFHGPRLRCVKRLRRWSKNAVEADLEVLPTDQYFADAPGAPLVTNAALLDAIGQLAAFWLTELLGWNHYCFPYRISRYEQYGDPLAAGTRLLCRGEIRQSGDMMVEARFDLVGEDGRLLLRLEGWEDRQFEVPARFHKYRLHPQTEFLSEEIAAVDGAVMRRAQAFPEHLLDTSYGIWKRVLAHMLLSRREREIFAALPKQGPRREEWLMGRIAAKDAVRIWAQRSAGVALAPADIEIINNAEGRPEVLCRAVNGPMPAISISHSARHAVAALTAAGGGVGIDLQSLNRIDVEALAGGGLTAEEARLVRAAAPGDAPRIAAAIWSAKEAAAKALGTGLGGRPDDFRVSLTLSEPRHGVETAFADVSCHGRRLHVVVHFAQDEVLALCVLPAHAAAATTLH